ncbi:MAG: aminoglycoside phosphotransferase family protein [Oscillospiraceae bacterium]|nr:aminoglycoside phosphotransferase family protein [Oscillospiraceae bacterium]
MKTNYSEAQIEKLIMKHYSNIANLESLSGGLVSQTFFFQSGDSRYVFQIGDRHEDYEKQHYIFSKFGKAIPVREVVGVHQTEDGAAYCFSNYIEGRKLFDLSDDERRETAEPVISVLLRMSEVELPVDSGYGRFDANGKAPYETWHDYIAAIYNDKVYDWSLLSNKNFNDMAVPKAIDELAKNIQFAQIDKAYLVNGDAGSYNIIAFDGQITGLIDCGSALYGDPLYCMANLLFWNEDKLHYLISLVKQRYYTDEYNKQKLYCYALRIGLEEIYNTVILNEIGYDISWVNNRLEEIVMHGLQ